MNSNEKLLDALLNLVKTTPTLPQIKKLQKPSGRKKTKNGATHVIGDHFKPKFLHYIDDKPVTPAMYSRMHMGVKNPRKKNGSKSTH